MKNKYLKCFAPHCVAIVIFFIISLLYFSPEIFEGKTIIGHDSRTGMGQDLRELREKTGETSFWSGTMFCGMPTYQISQPYDSSSCVVKVRRTLSLEFFAPVGLVFMMLLGFYIMLLVFGARTDVAIFGAIGYAFSSYFFIIIGAGHIFKLLALTYIPPTIAGIALAYKGKYWAGGIVAALFLTFQIVSNHVQMSYYFLFVIAAYVIYEFVKSIKNKTLPQFVKASAVLCVAGLLAIAINSSNLYHTWQYGKGTMRGGTELSHNSGNQTAGGLTRDYMTQWSYGIGETWTLLIPNAKGGATNYLGNSKNALSDAPQQFRQALAQQNAYWGDQPFTSGPVYAGAIFVFLFVLAMFLLKTKLKWALFAVLVLTVMLSWGKNMMWLTDFFADYVPMYSKFRSVSSLLVVAEFIIPLLATLVLIKIVRTPEILIKNKTKVYISLGLTGGLALIFAIAPGIFFNFLSSAESDAFYKQAQQNPQMLQFMDALESVRRGVFSADAWRTFAFIAAAAVLLFLYAKKILKNSSVFVGLLALLCLIDMWSVDKRYLGEKDFIPKTKNFASFFPKTAADIEILKDTDPDFRVFNTTTDAFNESNTSFYHKSVGGYHAAKLSRYQDIIEYYLSKGKMNVFNMLNTKYFIVAGNDKRPMAQRNFQAMGNAWFVENVEWVNNADEELASLDSVDLHATAVADKRFENMLNGKTFAKDSTSIINLTSYKPNELHYKTAADKDGFVVFSEIYYTPGWRATIDGVDSEILRVNYILRGLYVPAGNHEIVFTFNPASVKTTETIAWIGIIILVLASVGYVVVACKKQSKEQ